MRKRKNAFTLIELLAVIVILAIIALIATPIILGIVEDAKKDAFLRSVELLVGTTDIDITNKTFEEEYTYTITDGDISNLEVGVKNTTGMNGNITYDINGNESYAIHNGVYCVIKTDNNTEVSDYEEGKCIIPPVLTESDISFITFNDLEYIYDGTEKEIVVNNLSDEFSVTYVNNKGTNVGNYNATAIITGKNYRGSITKEATLTIQKASLTLKAEDKTSKQGEEIEELTYQVVSGTIYGNDELNINLTKEDGTEIGTYNIFVNADNINYEIILVNGIYTITVGFTSESCFAFSNGSITNYYDYEENNSSNKACPRDVIIPETINGVTVTKLNSNAFKSKNLTSVQFPSTLTSIGAYTFSGNKLTGEIDLSNTNITLIGDRAFIGESDGSTNQITSVKLPSSLTTTGSYVFTYNAISGELDLSNTKLNKITQHTFEKNKITSVKLPNSVTNIEESAFRYNKLSGELDLSNTKINSIGTSTFGGSSDGSTNQITAIKFPNSLISIGNYAFQYNKLSEELDLSDLANLTSLSGFEYNEITSVKFPNNLSSIVNDAFKNNKLSGELDLSYLTKLTIIGFSAFEGKTDGSANQITSVKFPNSLETIDSLAFQYNTINGQLDLSNTKVTTINNIAFRGNKIESIKFPSTLTSLGSWSFQDNKLKGEMDLSNTKLTVINEETFRGQSNGSTNQITSIKFPSTLEIINGSSFRNNAISGELDLSNTKVTRLKGYSFEGNQIASIKFPNTIENIEGCAFRYNILTSVTFYGRSDLTGVTVGSKAWGWAEGYSAENNIYFINE